MASPSIRDIDSFLKDSEVVGRKDDLSKMVSMLIAPNNQEHLSIIPIVGRAGLGKTTLAKLIYDKDTIKSHFDVRIWVSVSYNFGVERLLKEVLQSLTERKLETESRVEILESLQDEIGNKRFLLVLDDVWNQDPNMWGNFKGCLLRVSRSNGNAIMVTTRSMGVASMAQRRSERRLCLQQLSDDDCWSIFQKEVFLNGEAPKIEDLEAIGKQIVAKCKGVPLAIKVAGSMLRCFKKEQDWLSILESGLWVHNEEEDEVLPMLKLSFSHLPSSSIKQCFAFCAIFAKDFSINREQLIQLWMAHGFFQPNESNDVVEEEMGNEHFNTLLQNYLFQDVEKDEYDNITVCKMHALVRDLALSISKSEIFSIDASLMNEIPHVKHLAIYSGTETLLEGQQGNVRDLRTLFFRTSLSNNTLMSLTCLRVLDLSFAMIEELPTSVSELIHLRYLDLSETKIQVLPKSIGEVYNLQTLRLENCGSLRRLPNDLQNLFNLRHLHLKGCSLDEMPLGIGQLIHLRTLQYFKVGREKGCKIEELKDLGELGGRLEMLELENVFDAQEAQLADLGSKTNLCKLTFCWSGTRDANTNHEKVLEGLQPAPELKGLEIKNFGGSSFPDWIMKMAVSSVHHNKLKPLNNLVTIKLEGCNRCEKIPVLGKLPILRDLVLVGMDNVNCISKSFYGHSYNETSQHGDSDQTLALFPSLKRLELKGMRNLVEWREAVEIAPTTGRRGEMVSVFPCLEELTIGNCPELRTAPSHFPFLKKLKIEEMDSGLPLVKICQNLTTLRHLNIYGVRKLNSLPEQLLQSNRYLTTVTIESCPALTHVFGNVKGNGNFLRELSIAWCDNLRKLPEGLHNLTSLESLTVIACENLELIPSMEGLSSLRKLSIWDCNELSHMPSGLQSCTFMESLSVVSCHNLQSFPDVQLPSSLCELQIFGCPTLKCLSSKSISGLTHLQSLAIGWFSKDLLSFPIFDGIEYLQAYLRHLDLYGWPHWNVIPDQFQQFTCLTDLRIIGFGVEAVPEWIGEFSSLSSLGLQGCHNLKYLPSMKAMRRLTNLKTLKIYDCPQLPDLPQYLPGTGSPSECSMAQSSMRYCIGGNKGDSTDRAGSLGTGIQSKHGSVNLARMQKVVLELEVFDDKVKEKAMKIATRIRGVKSISMDMKDKKLTLVGKNIDTMAIVGKLRKVCPTTVLSVEPATLPGVTV